MIRRFILIGSILGMTAVGLGAFGAHILKTILTEYQVQIFETGVRYQFYHTFALIAAAFLGRWVGSRWTSIACWLFLAGIVCFSGSLYALALIDVLAMQALAPVLGPVTPLGGLLFMAGWLVLFRAGFDYKGSRR
jgi:uncharacterized membrane protein YgdD (TMEM256/DUF423 family)